MDYTITIPNGVNTLLEAKATRDGTTVQAMIDTKVAQYIVDVRREIGEDVDAEIQKRLEGKTLAEKAAILATL